MDGKTSSKLTGLISKLTVAANKAVKKNRDRRVAKRQNQDFNPTLKITQLENNLRTA